MTITSKGMAIPLSILIGAFAGVASAEQQGTALPSTITATHIQQPDIEGACAFFNTPELLDGTEYIPFRSPSGELEKSGVLIQHAYALLGAKHGEFENCRVVRYLYRPLPDGSLSERTVGLEKKRKIFSADISHKFEVPYGDYTETYSQRDEELNGCPVRIYWISVDKEASQSNRNSSSEFALISIPSKLKLRPELTNSQLDLDRDFVDCTGWKALREEQHYLVSHRVRHRNELDIDSRYAVESDELPIFALINDHEEFACYSSNDVFAKHLIVRKDFFDRAMRDKLRELTNLVLSDSKFSKGPMAYISKMEQASRAVSDWMLDFANKHGCK